MQKIHRPGERWTAYQHDPFGNVIRADYYDDTWEIFGYDKNGSLLETANEHVTVKLERDSSGQVISQWQYDITGRPTNHRISSQNRHTRRRVYQWDVNHRLKGMVNELTAGRTTYGYDEFSNLVWSNQGNQFDFLHRSVDDVGNLFETKDKKDRVYGAGSRLLETRDAKFPYDEEGNLVQKVEKNGNTWQYEYYGNGMMSKVIKPDNTKVNFKYDSMGRRIEKSSDEKTMQFVWDGNTILHEYFTEDDSVELENLAESQNNSEIPENLVTWVFNDGFVPSAKITSQGNYSIISGYLGTPVEAYDEKGNRVWSAELDIYGRVEEFTGEQDFIPFRYQGQYEDVEIGLYYNRFRYYDQEQGNYTQIDPIGLAGGNPTLYGYVDNPNIFIDPLGLYKMKNPTDIINNVPIYGKAQITSLSHAIVISQLAEDAAISGKYKAIFLDRAWNTANQTATGTFINISRKRPDLILVDHQNKMYSLEVASLTDDPNQLRARNAIPQSHGNVDIEYQHYGNNGKIKSKSGCGHLV